jgi:two-component system response regulator YesN
VLEYIEEHYKSDISIEQLSKVMNVSPTYFSNSFKKAFHVSPKQFILNKRLTESQQLLLETDMSVKEIAYAVGFENENYFSEFFAQKIGVSALKYRKRAFPRNRDCIL